jgi:uncharacterized protein (TIGR03086 family)
MTKFDLGTGVNELIKLVGQVGDRDLVQQTPCPLYTVEGLVGHIDGLAQAFTDAARKARSARLEQPPNPHTVRLEDDWRVETPRHLRTLADAWRDPQAWEGMTRIAGLDAPAEMVALTVADEIVVHGWDLARALGRDYTADPVLVEASRSFLTAFTSADAPAGDDVAFGPTRSAPAGASPLEQVVALAGRDVTWSPPSQA